MTQEKLPKADELWRLYSEEELSAQAIADRFGACQVSVIKKLNRAGYKLRSRQEALRLAYKSGRHKITVPRGEDHWLWKGDKDRRQYRRKIKKVKCESCGGKLNLSIHHRNFDHYDDESENLQVLCVSCHMSLHKQAYWDAVKAGKEPPKSNGPIGWRR